MLCISDSRHLKSWRVLQFEWCEIWLNLSISLTSVRIGPIQTQSPMSFTSCMRRFMVAEGISTRTGSRSFDGFWSLGFWFGKAELSVFWARTPRKLLPFWKNSAFSVHVTKQISCIQLPFGGSGYEHATLLWHPVIQARPLNFFHVGNLLIVKCKVAQSPNFRAILCVMILLFSEVCRSWRCTRSDSPLLSSVLGSYFSEAMNSFWSAVYFRD